jgi:DNA polymerase III sliding clamp (beta) subunit (PCNA family)
VFAVGVERAGGGRFCVIAAAQLAAAIQQVSFAIADPAVRAELGAVWVETKEDSLRLVAIPTASRSETWCPTRLGPLRCAV